MDRRHLGHRQRLDRRRRLGSRTGRTGAAMASRLWDDFGLGRSRLGRRRDGAGASAGSTAATGSPGGLRRPIAERLVQAERRPPAAAGIGGVRAVQASAASAAGSGGRWRPGPAGGGSRGDPAGTGAGRSGGRSASAGGSLAGRWVKARLDISSEAATRASDSTRTATVTMKMIGSLRGK